LCRGEHLDRIGTSRNGIDLRLGFIKTPSQQWEANNMAAFCACCGAEITLKAEACTVCGTPRHGMLNAEMLRKLEADAETSDQGRDASQTLTGPESSHR
jgi:hypothetical protein